MTFKRTAATAAGALFLIGTSALARLAAHAEMIDADMMTRMAQIAIGLSLVVLANGAPKQIGRPRASLEAEGRAQAARRAAARSLTLAGLIYSGVWVLAPIALAAPVSIGVVVIGLSLAIVYALIVCRSQSADVAR